MDGDVKDFSMKLWDAVMCHNTELLLFHGPRSPPTPTEALVQVGKSTCTASIVPNSNGSAQEAGCPPQVASGGVRDIVVPAESVI